eukprot:299451_1
MALVYNLNIYSCKSLEAGNPVIRFAVRHKARIDVTNSDAIYRHFKFRYIMIFLVLGGGFDTKGEMTLDPKKMKIRLPESYLNNWLKKYSKDDALNGVSRLVEMKYHPNNPRFTNGFKTKGKSEKVDDGYEHKINWNQKGDTIIFSPINNFTDHMMENKNKKIKVIKTHKIKTIDWYHQGKHFIAKVGNLVLYKPTEEATHGRIMKIYLITEICFTEGNNNNKQLTTYVWGCNVKYSASGFIGIGNIVGKLTFTAASMLVYSLKSWSNGEQLSISPFCGEGTDQLVI